MRRSVLEADHVAENSASREIVSLLGCLGSRTHVFEDGCHLKQAKDTKTGVASTAYPVFMFMK